MLTLTLLIGTAWIISLYWDCSCMYFGTWRIDIELVCGVVRLEYHHEREPYDEETVFTLEPATSPTHEIWPWWESNTGLGPERGFVWPQRVVWPPPYFGRRFNLPLWLPFVLAATITLWLHRPHRPRYLCGHCKYCGQDAAKPGGTCCSRCQRFLRLARTVLGTIVLLWVYVLQVAMNSAGLLFFIWGTIALLFFALPTALSLWHRRKHHPRGFCLDCGYSLTGNVSGICPECGEVIPPAVDAVETT